MDVLSDVSSQVFIPQAPNLEDVLSKRQISLKGYVAVILTIVFTITVKLLLLLEGVITSLLVLVNTRFSSQDYRELFD